MDDLLLMDIPDSRDKLAEEFSGVSFAKITMGENMIKEFSSGSILQDNSNVLVRLYNIIQAYDVGVFKHLEKKKN